MNIVLIGMPGAGKTSVGKLLTERLGRRLIDTDACIEAIHGNISEIFAAHGETYFRTLENELVRSLSAEDNLVISTGGGLVLVRENYEILRKRGKFVYLCAGYETLRARLEGSGKRPLLNGNSALYELFAVRTPQYEEIADIAIETDGRMVEEVVEIIGREVLQ